MPRAMMRAHAPLRRRWRWLADAGVVAQLLEPLELRRERRERRVEPARVRHDEHARTLERLRLWARARHGELAFEIEHDRIERHADESDHVRLHRTHLLEQPLAAARELLARELGGGLRR